MANLGNMYPNLPGMLVEFKDGGQALKFDEVDVNTDSMLILGTAEDGPVMEPVAVDENTAELLFGSELKSNGAPNGSTLIRGFKEAKACGCQDIRLMRITGSEAKTVIKAPSEEIDLDIRVDENVGYTTGNEETVLSLLGIGVKKDSVEVTAKGRKIDSKLITVDTDEVTSKTSVMVAENACDAGAVLAVTYNYEREEDKTDTGLILSAEKQLVLSKVPVKDSVKVRKVGSEDYIESSLFTVEGRTITLLEGSETQDAVVGKTVAGKTVAGKTPSPAKTSAGDTYIVEYKFMKTGEETENVDDKGNGLLSKTGEQKVVLSGFPKDQNSISLYIENTLVLDKGAYKVDLDDNCLILKKEYFGADLPISVSYYATKKEVVNKEIAITSLFGGDVYNEAKIEVLDLKDENGLAVTKAVRLTKPSSKLGSGEAPLVFTSYNFETFGELVEAINTYSGIFKAETKTPDEKTTDLIYAETYFRGGDNGINVTKDELFEALSGKRDANSLLEKQGAYQLLENYQVDWITPLGVYADDKLLDKNKDFAYELALFCSINSFRNKTIFGAIPMKPLQDTSLASVQSHAKYLANFSNQYFMKDNRGSVIVDGSGNPIDLGKFISLIAGPTVTVNHQSYSLKDGLGTVAYIAANTVMLPQSAPTNKRIKGTTGIKYNFSDAQLNEIAKNRMVCFGRKYSTRGQVLDGAYIVDGPTCARSGSEYARLSTLKVMREVADQTREVADPYIGEANTIEQRNALSAALSKRYDALVTSGVIIDYSFNLVATQQDQVLGQASLELGIVAPQELRKITTVMGLKR